jgi:hypothetical protein
MIDTAVAVDTAILAHQIPGRFRLRVGSILNNPARAAEVEDRLADVPVIEYARANPKTGSVVVEYAPEFDAPREVLSAIENALQVVISDEPFPRPAATSDYISSEQAAQRLRGLVERANAQVGAAAGGLDLRLLLPGALICLGVGAFLGSRRRRMPAWHDLIWYGFNTFQMLNPPKDQGENFTYSK